jgi:hypothetical protein
MHSTFNKHGRSLLAIGILITAKDIREYSGKKLQWAIRQIETAVEYLSIGSFRRTDSKML